MRMNLSAALPIFKEFEIKMSEAYLWCSINREELELRKFFSSMSDAELGHARVLDAISKRSELAGTEIEIPDDLVNSIKTRIEGAISSLKNERDLDRTFEIVAEMEKSELNDVFESIVRSLGTKVKFDNLEITTGQHIKELKEMAVKLALAAPVQQSIEGLRVKDHHYYRLFTD